MTWRRFTRRGTVSAERLETPLRWRADTGDELVASAGDWRVTDGTRSWTVTDDSFRRSYEPVPGGFRRCGVVRARPGRPGEIVQTLEGPAGVRPGDWVVEGEEGEQWPVPADPFSAAYQPEDGTDADER